MGIPDQVDVVVVGAGASGLSLLAHLAASPLRHLDVLVLDDGSHGEVPDRAWAFWSRRQGLLDDAVSTTFDRFRVRTAGSDRLVRLGSYRYRVVRGADLVEATDRLLAGAPGFRRRTGHVSEVRDGRDGAAVVVDGQTVRARWVFDSAGVGPGDGGRLGTPGGTGAAVDALEFTGRRIEAPEGTFDPAAPVLMDFRTAQGPDLGFVYVLPESSRVALVEHTRFTRHRAGTHPDGDQALETYLRDVLAPGEHRVLSQERGTIPLQPAEPPGRARARGSVVAIGTTAGMVKASTGYGWTRIQRHSDALTRSLARHGHPFDVAGGPARYRVLDHILLTAVAREPDRVVDAFERLFARNPGDAVLAFLDEESSLRQELHLVRSLPVGPFLRALLPAVRTLPRR